MSVGLAEDFRIHQIIGVIHAYIHPLNWEKC